MLLETLKDVRVLFHFPCYTGVQLDSFITLLLYFERGVWVGFKLAAEFITGSSGVCSCDFSTAIFHSFLYEGEHLSLSRTRLEELRQQMLF